MSEFEPDYVTMARSYVAMLGPDRAATLAQYLLDQADVVTEPGPSGRLYRPKFEYKVVYRRMSWTGRKGRATRLYQSRRAALGFVKRLTSEDRPDLAPLVDLWVEFRPVGNWFADDAVIVDGQEMVR